MWNAHLAEAKATRLSGRLGQRFDSLSRIRQLVGNWPARELRNHAIACMALADLRHLHSWTFQTGRTLAFDGNLERYAEVQPDGSVLIKQVRDQNELALVVGDLNTTPWSPYFKDLLKLGALRNSMKGWGVQTTWPATSYPLRIPIDHALHSPGLVILNREIGPDVGSDHLPVILDVHVSDRERGI